jgi:divalent metal cation (Fe/Co/Zn/Cd) transporter
VVAAFIIRTAYSITSRSADGLLDRTLPEHEMRIVKEILLEHETHFADWHRLRTRKTGSERQLDLHVTVPSAMSVSESHTLIEAMESEIRLRLPRSTIVIHVEPCEKDCETCRMAESERIFRKCK